jgi:signal transduction histidine kinase
MRVLAARWLAGGVAAASVALMAGSLALALADRLAALGGRLEVRSAPGQGTTITGHLPVPAASGNHQAPESRFGSVTQRA